MGKRVPQSRYDIILATLKEDGLKLRNYEEQTEEMCLISVRQNPNALLFVNEITDAIRTAAKR